MPKHTNDYDNVFKTMKVKHKRLFIPVINEAFHRQYPPDAEPEVLPSEGYFTEQETGDGREDIEEQITDFLIRLEGEVYLIEKRLFPYIPFYITRYERDIATGRDIEAAVADLTYFKDELLRLYEEGELAYHEMADLTGFVNTIITHITDGNENEERLVGIMGGTVIETESERLIRIGRERGIEQGIERGIERGMAEDIVEFAREIGWQDEQILQRLQKKLGISLEKAREYLDQFGGCLQ